MKHSFLKPALAFAAAVTVMGSYVPAYAQNAEDVMHPLDLTEPGIYSNPAIEMWKDLLEKANAEQKGNPATSGQPITGYVFSKEFKDGDTTVSAPKQEKRPPSGGAFLFPAQRRVGPVSHM